MIHSRALHPKLLRLLTIQTFANTTKVPNPFGHHDHHDHHDSHHDSHHGHHGSRPAVEYNTITSFLDHKNLNTYFECKCMTKRQRDLDICIIQGSTIMRPMVSPMIGGMIPITIRIIRFQPRILAVLIQRHTCGHLKAN